MTFTYVGTLATDLDKVRFYIADRVVGSGPRPGGANFTDEEINGALTIEGNWQRTIAALFEVLASEWSDEVNITVGPRREELSQTAAHYLKQAATWRARYGKAAGAAGSGFITKVDGYSDDIPADSIGGSYNA